MQARAASIIVVITLVVASLPSAARAAETTGVIAVESVPEGAAIVVDGAAVGSAPARATVEEGAHIVDARWPDGRTATTSVIVLGGSTASVRLDAPAAATPPPTPPTAPTTPPPTRFVEPSPTPAAPPAPLAIGIYRGPTQSRGLRPWEQMAIAGGVTFAITWIGAMGISAGFADYNPNASRVGYAPFGGPFAAYDRMNDTDRAGLGPVAAVIGVLQIASFSVLIAGGAWGIAERVKQRARARR